MSENSERDIELKDSQVDGTKKRERGPAEKARQQNNHRRDMRVNLGTGKPAEIVVD
jgi:hypothetical protein